LGRFAYKFITNLVLDLRILLHIFVSIFADVSGSAYFLYRLFSTIYIYIYIYIKMLRNIL